MPYLSYEEASLESSKDVSVKGDDTPLPEDVAAVFEGYPADKRARILELRGLILDCAQRLFGSASVTESLKWGEPSYRPLPIAQARRHHSAATLEAQVW